MATDEESEHRTLVERRLREVHVTARLMEWAKAPDGPAYEVQIRLGWDAADASTTVRLPTRILARAQGGDRSAAWVLDAVLTAIIAQLESHRVHNREQDRRYPSTPPRP